VTGRGERFRGGGRVVKNVTGYDLPKLLAGSWGTLAILTELTVRVHPAPDEERTLVIESVDLARALALIGAGLASACAISGAAFVPTQGVALRLEGFSGSVRARAEDLLELLRPREAHWLEAAASRALWREIGAVGLLAGHEIVWRLSVPPSDAQHLIEALAPAAYLLDWGGGLLWMAFASAAPERVRGALRSGHARLVKAPAAVRATTAVFHPLPEALSGVSARLKAAFDPQLRLNPGRLD
jgi:glycolate oxidase FAD binding subunit